MLLALDVGNTNITIGIFKKKKIISYWRVFTERGKTSDEYGIQLINFLENSGYSEKNISGIVICSVVPPLTPIMVNMAEKFFKKKPMVVSRALNTGIKILYKNPDEVGEDRIVNAVAAFNKYGGPAIIVDFGTAITFDIILEKGEYLGGVIAPGVEISSEALAHRTAKLPKVEIKKPEKVVGKTTIESIQSGLYFGYESLVEGIIKKIKKELGIKANVILTGGYGEEIFGKLKIFNIVDPFLTLEGLRIIYERNS
ncbi:MAG: type III pantothenate kinase [Acidobacteriota bacterium]